MDRSEPGSASKASKVTATPITVTISATRLLTRNVQSGTAGSLTAGPSVFWRKIFLAASNISSGIHFWSQVVGPYTPRSLPYSLVAPDTYVMKGRMCRHVEAYGSHAILAFQSWCRRRGVVQEAELLAGPLRWRDLMQFRSISPFQGWSTQFVAWSTQFTRSGSRISGSARCLGSKCAFIRKPARLSEQRVLRAKDHCRVVGIRNDSEYWAGSRQLTRT